MAPGDYEVGGASWPASPAIRLALLARKKTDLAADDNPRKPAKLQTGRAWRVYQQPAKSVLIASSTECQVESPDVFWNRGSLTETIQYCSAAMVMAPRDQLVPWPSRNRTVVEVRRLGVLSLLAR